MEQYRDYSGEKLAELARDEVVAEMCETMLTDTDAAAKVSRKLYDTDRSLWGKVKEFFSGLVEKLRKAYAELNPDSAIARQVKDTVTRSEAVVNAWAEAVSDAAVNYQLQDGQKNNAREGVRLSPRVGTSDDGKSMYEGSFPKGTPKSAKSAVILQYIQNVWSKDPIPLEIIESDGTRRKIMAQFDPFYDPTGEKKSDASKIAGGNRHGTSAEQRVTLDLGPDYHDILSESEYNYSKDETGKETFAHEGVKTWHYFVDEIYFAEKGSTDFNPYIVSINVKEKENGNFVYSFSAEKGEFSTPGTLHAPVDSPVSGAADAEPSGNNVAQSNREVNGNMLKSSRNNVSQETKDAIAAYKAQRDAADKHQKELYEAERKRMEKDYRRQMDELRNTYNEDTAAYHEEFFSSMKTKDFMEAKMPTLRKMLNELAKENSGGNKDAEAARKQVYENLRQQYELNKDIKNLEAKVKHQREAARAKVESRRKTEERHKIQRTVQELNRYLLHPTTTVHVPAALQSSVARAMEAINISMSGSKASQYADRLSEYAYQLRELQKNPSENAEKIAEVERKIRTVTDRDGRQRGEWKLSASDQGIPTPLRVRNRNDSLFLC